MRPRLHLANWLYSRSPSRRAFSLASAFQSVPPSPNRYGRYTPLPSSSALAAYPPPRPVPVHIPRPPYVPKNFFTAPIWEHEVPEWEGSRGGGIEEMMMKRSKEGLGELGKEGVRKAGRLAALILKRVGELVKPGVTTDDLDKAAHHLIVEAGAYPSPLGYSAFPRSITTSVNNVIAHGIPDDRPLREDDIVNLDITLYLDGYHGDTSATFLLPRVDDAGHELVEQTKESLKRALDILGPGTLYRSIGETIHNFADKAGLSVNTQFTGHGIGRNFHQFPYVLHHRNHEEGVMEVGDCFTIEPALVQGSNARGTLWEDGWTVATETGARSAQFEHQVLITEDGAQILTRLK